MPWYPDWLVALDECAKSEEGARYGRGIVLPRHARDIIAQLTALKRENKRLRAANVTSSASRDDPPER